MYRRDLAGWRTKKRINEWWYVLDLPPNDNLWPMPDRDERLRRHAEQAQLAEQEKKWLAVAFKPGRLLLDQPDDPDRQRPKMTP